MPDLVQELNSLDFSVYIGGPLQAAIKAQQDASMSQVEFIKAVGFQPDPASNPGAPKPPMIRYVDFAYAKSKPNPNFGSTSTTLPPGTNTTSPTLTENTTLKVPFITMLTMPAIRIEEITIDFNAKLSSVETKNVASEFNVSAELGINFRRVNFKATTSYKRTANTGSSVEKTYSLAVHVRAVNDELPAGLDRLLNLLEDSIKAG